MLLRADELAGIASGELTLAFRRWVRPTVRAGGTLRTPAGVLAIDAVDVVEVAAITDADARRAGHADRAALIARLDRVPRGRVHRIALRPAGPDPRVALRRRGDIDDDEAREVLAVLALMDRRSRRRPWTMELLRAIADAPGAPALKRDVRRLKELGLTESLPAGYRLSPRGRAVLAAADRRAAPAPR